MAVLAAGVLAVAAAQSLPAVGQAPVPVSVSIAPEVPAGFSTQNLPTQVTQRVIVTVVNSGTAPVVNEQLVVRLGNKPDSIIGVSDGLANVGVLDLTSGAWYHTIPSIAAGATATFTLSWVKICPGRWPLAVRVADKLASISAQWVGPSDPRCGPDELASPQPPSFYQLAWPPTAPIATTTTALAPGATTTALIIAPGATTIPGVSTTTILGAGSTTTATTSTTKLGVTQPSLIQLTLSTSSTTAPKPSTTVPKSTTTKPGTVILCKTVGGKRYCAPKSSAYKEGQKKSVEVKPKTTKKKK